MTDYADLQKRLRDPNWEWDSLRIKAADAIAALVAERDRLRGENTNLRLDYADVRERAIEAEEADGELPKNYIDAIKRIIGERAALQAKLERVRETVSQLGRADIAPERIFIDELDAILDEPNDVAGAGASVSISADARVSHLSPAEAAIKPGPSSAEPSGEQLEEGDEILVKAKFVKDYGNLAGVCYALVHCAGDTDPYVAAYEDILRRAEKAEPAEGEQPKPRPFNGLEFAEASLAEPAPEARCTFPGCDKPRNSFAHNCFEYRGREDHHPKMTVGCHPFQPQEEPNNG